MYAHIWEVQIAAANFFQESLEVNHHTKVTFPLQILTSYASPVNLYYGPLDMTIQ